VVLPTTTKEELLAHYWANKRQQKQRELQERFQNQTPDELTEYLKQQAKAQQDQDEREGKPQKRKGPTCLYKGVSFPGDD